jgi:LytS/YehU family sensor histidine kinase
MSPAPGVALTFDRAVADSAMRRSLLIYWALQLAAWGFCFWWQARGEVIFASAPGWKAATLWGGFSLQGLVLTEGLRRLSKRQAWLELPSGVLLLRLAASVFIITCIAYAASLALSAALYGDPIDPMLQSFYRKLAPSIRLFNEFLRVLTVYLAWIGAYFSLAMIRHRHQAEVRQLKLSEALQAAELSLLKSQLNPHFLFNALNSVRALIADEPTKAQDAVTQLARTLRYTLACGGEELVTLARELEMVEDYLALESLRLADRLQVFRDLEPVALEASIPVMLLQVLVENAIKHGIAPLKVGGTVRIAARVTRAGLLVEVENPRGPQCVQALHEGLGLRNSTRRLSLLFGSRASLELDLADPVRAVARLRLPR